MGLNPAIFVADALALDFLNTVATPVDTPVEFLETGQSLFSWLRQAQLVAPSVLERMEAQALPGELDALADQARALREWFRKFVIQHRGRPLAPKVLDQLEPLNRLLARDDSFAQVTRGPAGALELTPQRRWRSPEALLLPIAGTLAHFVCSQDFTHIKACEGPSCTLLFADHTRGHARRWCSMALCGNRAKQAAHRHRQKINRA